VVLEGLESAKVLVLLEGIGSGLASHNLPNCQDVLAEENTLSMA
jgi:hypothetical protein